MLPACHAWENDARTILGYGNQWAQSWETRAAGYERQRGNERFQQFEARHTDVVPASIPSLLGC